MFLHGVIDNNHHRLDDDGDGLSEEEGDDYESATYRSNTEMAWIGSTAIRTLMKGTPFFDDDGDCYCESALLRVREHECSIGAVGLKEIAVMTTMTTSVQIWSGTLIRMGTFEETQTGSMTSCTQPFGYVSNAQDCDDTSAYAWTGNPESRDGYDNDCDGAVDEGVTTTYYQDLDGDLWFEYGHDRGMFTAAKLCFDCRRL